MQVGSLKYATRWPRIVAIAVAAIFVSQPNAAEVYPDRPIRLMVGYPAGSGTDFYARAIAQRLQETLKQAVVVDNRPGAAGNIAADAVARARPDGYTLLVTASQIVINPFVQKNAVDVLKDLQPISQIMSVSYVLITLPSFPAKNISDFAAYARANGGKLNCASYGPGSGTHLAMAMLLRASSLDIQQVQYRGSSQVITAVLSGEVSMAFEPSTTVVPYVQGGKLRAIAVGGSHPVTSLPGVAPISRDYPGYDSDGWQGVFAPAGTPKSIVDALSTAVRGALQDPGLQHLSESRGVRLVGSTPDAFGAYVHDELEKYRRVVRENNISVE
jgi:tripartite-type tricarboxylate transporter receptor subunit TctC